MKIEVFLHTTLQRKTRVGSSGHLVVDLPADSLVADLLEELGFEVDVEDTLLVVNGRNVELTQALSDGDKVHLIPAISGG